MLDLVPEALIVLRTVYLFEILKFSIFSDLRRCQFLLKIDNSDQHLSVPGAHDSLLEPMLDQVGVNIVGGAGGAAAVPQVAVVVKVEVGVAEEVAIALEQVEQLFGGVLVH